jgi:hypothetical protein
MRGGRRVNVMSMLVKEAQGILPEQAEGQCIETSREVSCILATDIEEENIVSSSEDDDVEDETYWISPRAARRAASNEEEEEEIEDAEDEPFRQVEDEEEEWNGNPQQIGRVLFPRKPTIRRPHKPLSYNAISYQGKGSTKEVKRLRKIDPRPQPKGALDYRFHTHLQQDIYETVIMVRRRIVPKAQWVD